MSCAARPLRLRRAAGADEAAEDAREATVGAWMRNTARRRASNARADASLPMQQKSAVKTAATSSSTSRKTRSRRAALLRPRDELRRAPARGASAPRLHRAGSRRRRRCVGAGIGDEDVVPAIAAGGRIARELQQHRGRRRNRRIAQAFERCASPRGDGIRQDGRQFGPARDVRVRIDRNVRAALRRGRSLRACDGPCPVAPSGRFVCEQRTATSAALPIASASSIASIRPSPSSRTCET